MVSCGSTWAIASKAVIEGAPATVVYDVGDAAFTVLEQDRGPNETDAPICLDCLLELQPGLGRGLDVAHEHGVAVCIDGEWKERSSMPNPATRDGGTARLVIDYVSPAGNKTGGHKPERDGRHPEVLDISPPDGSGSRGSSFPEIAGPDNDLEPLVG